MSMLRDEGTDSSPFMVYGRTSTYVSRHPSNCLGTPSYNQHMTALMNQMNM
ncbi:hypothetical protein AAZX31_06G173200 [Glycine max]